MGHEKNWMHLQRQNAREVMSWWGGFLFHGLEFKFKEMLKRAITRNFPPTPLISTQGKTNPTSIATL